MEWLHFGAKDGSNAKRRLLVFVRVMSGNARITLMVRTGGAVYLALRSSSGDVQRICQTTAVPTLGNVMHIGYSWDGSRLALSVYDTTAKTLVPVSML